MGAEARPLSRNISEIADAIYADYREQKKAIYFGAEPYIDAMTALDTMDLSTPYGAEDAYTIIAYALSNLTYWRGDTAKSIKAELKSALVDYRLRSR